MLTDPKLAFNSGGAAPEQGRLFESIDQLMTALDFESTRASLTRDNELNALNAFRDFIGENRFFLSQKSLEVLLEEEKMGEYSLRRDKETPNWYHELRQILTFVALVRSETLSLKELAPYGGMDVMVAAILRHDSLEDFAKTHHEITQALYERVQELKDQGVINQDEFKTLNNQVPLIIDIADRMSRKIAVLDENRFPKKDTTGKHIYSRRFDGDMNQYLGNLIAHPLACLAKYLDSIEGTSTPTRIDSFSPAHLDQRRDYADERRQLFGRTATDALLMNAFPAFKKSIKAVDALLGVNLVIMETLNYYQRNPINKPSNAPAIDIARYMKKDRLKPFQHIPPAFRADCIFLERLHETSNAFLAKKDNWFRDILFCAILPAFKPYQAYYPERLLPKDINSRQIGICLPPPSTP
ncbi:MAG: hypothetical protein J0L77_01745 [Alphaproteobacteria bacterium]|nr:hypothetical protein [Alphaproteobacteria bacterium]